MIRISDSKRSLFEMMTLGQSLGLGYITIENDSYCGRLIKIRGRELINFANCSYLALDTDERLKTGVINATQKHGSLLSNSRSCFSSPLYEEFELLIDKILPGYQVVTTTTTLGHCSALPLFIEPEDVIIFDQFAHNSLRMAALQCKGLGSSMTMVRHSDMNRLEKNIKRMTKQKARNIWYLADGIYSMQGDFLPTNDLIDLLDKYQNFFVYVDDAHGFSWTGKHGAGHVLGNQFIHPKMITAVSMCKSFGAFGGIISFYDKKMADMLRYTGQSLIFSAPISPPILGAAIASARIHLADDIVHLQHDLLNRIYFFQQKCAEYEVPLVTDNAGPIQFIEIGNNDLVYSVALDLNKKGVYATPAVFPSMPKNHGGLRFSITRHISLDDIDMAVGYLSDILKTFTSNHFANNKTA